MKENKGKAVIGLDIGGGNVTAYVSILNNGGDPTPTKALSNEQETSVYTILKDGRKYWGDSLVKDMTASDLMEAACFKANFKALPGTGNDEDMIEFARMIFENVQETTNGFYGQEPVWIIGCPSSWPKLDKKVKKKYAALFQKAGMEKVVICEESTAAISYYDKALKVVTKDNTAKGVLLIDWGSSTLDATFILPPENGTMKRIETTGCALGAHFIDKAIIHITLYKQEAYGLQQLNDAALTRKVREKYENDEKFRILLDCRARLMKETYFRSLAKPGFRPKSTQLRWKETINLSVETSEWGEGDTYYTLGISIQMMEDILSMPIREVVTDFDNYNEFTQNDIGNDSFIRRNERFLEELHDRYTEYARTQDALIMLTGGASQMDFIRKAVSAYFPNHKIDYDNHPELSIGKGLAYYGREALQNSGWETLIEETYEDEDEPTERNENETSRTETDDKSQTETAEESERTSKYEVKEDQMPEKWRETIKNELREELIEELCTAFCTAFGGTFSEVFSDAFSEVYDEEFDDEEFEEEFSETFEEKFSETFHEALGSDDEDEIETRSGIILTSSVKKNRAGKSAPQQESSFERRFDRLVNDFDIKWWSENFFKKFIDEAVSSLIAEIDDFAKGGNAQSREYNILTQWKIGKLKTLKENANKELAKRLNHHFENLLILYEINIVLFDEEQPRDLMYVLDKYFYAMIEKVELSSCRVANAKNVIKGFLDSRKGKNLKTHLIETQYNTLVEILEIKKRILLAENKHLKY